MEHIPSEISGEERRDRVVKLEAVYKYETVIDVAKLYDDWTDYEKDMLALDYVGPKTTAAKLRYYFPNNKDVRILDVGCGTGWVAAELAALGYTNIDGVDASTALLSKARERKLYKNTVHAFVGGDEPVPLSDGTYDAVIGSAVLNEGHLPPRAIPDLYRLLKPGGVLMMLCNQTFWYTMPHHYIDMQAELDQLETDGKLKRLELGTMDDYVHCFRKTAGHFFAYRKLR